MMVAKEVNLKPNTLAHSISDAHIYQDQIPAVKELLKRQPKPHHTITISESPSGDIFNHKLEDFHLENYEAHPAMQIPVHT